jgi:hypothetical protein
MKLKFPKHDIPKHDVLEAQEIQIDLECHIWKLDVKRQCQHGWWRFGKHVKRICFGYFRCKVHIIHELVKTKPKKKSLKWVMYYVPCGVEKSINPSFTF